MTSHGQRQRLAAPSSPWWGFALYGKAAGKLRSKGSQSCQALEKSRSAKGKDEASSGIAPFYSGSAQGLGNKPLSISSLLQLSEPLDRNQQPNQSDFIKRG